MALYVDDTYWICDYVDPCIVIASGGGAGGGKKPHPHKIGGRGRRDSIADFAVHPPGAAEFFAASDANEPAQAIDAFDATPWSVPAGPSWDAAPSQAAMLRAGAAMQRAVDLVVQQTMRAQVEERARIEQQQKILSIVNFVDRLQ
ncbi:MAG: hypothetical protein ABIR94_21805 [Rubrivivax sp.]